MHIALRLEKKKKVITHIGTYLYQLTPLPKLGVFLKTPDGIIFLFIPWEQIMYFKIAIWEHKELSQGGKEKILHLKDST